MEAALRFPHHKTRRDGNGTRRLSVAHPTVATQSRDVTASNTVIIASRETCGTRGLLPLRSVVRQLLPPSQPMRDPRADRGGHRLPGRA